MVFTRNIIFKGSVIENKKGDRFVTPVPGHRSKIGSEMVLNGGDYVSELTLVQPEGIPLSPVVQLVEEGVVIVPVAATLHSQ